MRFNRVVMLAAAAMLCFSALCAEAAPRVDTNIFKWVQSSSRINYFFNQEQICFKVKDGQVVDEFSLRVNPCRPIPYYASRVHGISNAMVRNAPPFDVALQAFLEFAGDSILVGHNIHSFDMKFICRDAMRFWGQTVGNDYIDTLPFARVRLRGLRHHTLTSLAEYYGINTDGAHRALNDCRMNQQIFEYLAHGKLGVV